MKILIACETSGTVREAFRARGHDAVSCDILPDCSNARHPKHYQGSVFDIISDGWDMLIGHPPCTYLCASGMHWTTRGLRDPKLTGDALQFFTDLWCTPIPKICLENPVGIVSTRLCKPTQYIQPYWFGHDASKKTGLWLKNLPKLQPTEMVAARIVNGKPRWGNQTDSGQNRLGPSELRWKERSKTYEGIAKAMADTWG